MGKWLDKTGLTQIKGLLATKFSTKVDKYPGAGAGKYLQTDNNGNAFWGDPVSVNDIRDAAEDWLEANMSNIDSTVLLDTSLTTPGAAADAKSAGDLITVSDTTPTSGPNKLWIKRTPENEVTVPTYDEFDDLKSAIDATEETFSLVKTIEWTRGGIRTDTGVNNSTATIQKTRIRTSARVLTSGQKISPVREAYCFVFYYAGTTYLGYYSIPSGTVLDIYAYAQNNYPTATRYRLMAIKNPEGQIDDGTSSNFDEVLNYIAYNNAEESQNEQQNIKTNLSEIQVETLALQTQVEFLDSQLIKPVVIQWERGSINTSDGTNDRKYAMSRIRSIDILSTKIIIEKDSDTMVLVYFYNDDVYSSYHLFNNAGTIDVEAYAIENSITANGIRLVCLFNPESTIGDGTGTDYSSLLSLIEIKEFKDNQSNFKPYTSGFNFFTVKINKDSPITTGDANEVLDTESIVDVTCMIKLPATYTQNGKSTKLLMICHGAGRGMVGSNNWTTQTGYNNIVDAFNNAGYAVFDCQGYEDTTDGRTFWGAKKGVQTWRKAYEYIIENYNVDHEFCIYGFSMGGLTALGLAFDAYPNIKAIALASPVLDLTKCIDESTFQIAYGISGAVYDESKCRGCNPMAHLFEFNSEDVVFSKLPPLKIWYGGNETSTAQPYVEKLYAQKFVNAVINGGGYAVYREVVGVGHEICYGLVPAAITEYVMFLERY